MLRDSKVYGRDMRYHWNFYHTSDEALGEETLNVLKELNLKPYHPVSNVYADILDMLLAMREIHHQWQLEC